jgi:putative CocE/NonD family hydrolase
MKLVTSLVMLCGLLISFVQASVARQSAQLTFTSPKHSEFKLAPTRFDRFVGQYTSAADPYSILSFWREGDAFFVQRTDGTKLELFAESEKVFFTKVVKARVTFQLRARGKVAGLSLRQPNGDTSFLRKTSDRPIIESPQAFTKREAMIQMRDGVRLHTLIFTPQNVRAALPILLRRTPYGADVIDERFINRRYKEFVRDGYIFVLQDIRGRYRSEGQFMMMRPPRDRTDPKSVDESTDTYDTIDWLVKNAGRNNGRVGVFGVSYDGWLAAVATIEPHPALKASSPQAPMTDAYLGDDFFHNGAFRQSMSHEYVKMMETSKGKTLSTFDRDTYDWYLELGSLSRLTEEFQGKLPTWNAFVEHPNYDDYWKARGSQRYLADTSVPTLVVGGWWDQEDFFGALATYKALEKHDAGHQNFIVLGPWNHGGWKQNFGRSLGDLNFGSSTGLYFRSQVQAPWFAYYLKGKGRLRQPEALTFQAGSNKWLSYESWPPRDAVARDLFLQSNGKLSFEKPAPGNGREFESYVSDPAAPVPFRKRPIEAMNNEAEEETGWDTWLVQDQRFLQGRADVVSWQTEILDHDLTISGDIVAHLFASTTGTDSDWVVKLIDVYPDAYPEDEKMAGYRLMVAGEIFRGRFRESLETPKPLVPGEVHDYTLDLHGSDYSFKKGHRLMVQVQSTWFPLNDRNPQKFVENIFKAEPSDYQAATQRVYQSVRYPSHVTLPVVSQQLKRPLP